MQFPVTDQFLLQYGGLLPEGNQLEVDPEYGNMTITTPYSRFMFVHFAPPRPGKTNPDGSVTKPSYQLCQMFNPAGISEIVTALDMIADNNFNEEQRPGPDGRYVNWKPHDLLYAPPGMNGLLNPLKDGTEIWRNSNKPQLYEVQRGLFILNSSLTTTNKEGNAQSPVYLDEAGQPCSPQKFYSGCYGRTIVRLAPYPRRGQQGFGKRGISAWLQHVQFACHGEKLGSFDSQAAGMEAFARAGTIAFDPAFVKSMPPQGPQGAPPGGVPGFAVPPQQAYPQVPTQAPYQPSPAATDLPACATAGSADPAAATAPAGLCNTGRAAVRPSGLTQERPGDNLGLFFLRF